MYADILQILQEGIQMLSRITTGIGSCSMAIDVTCANSSAGSNTLSRIISRTTTTFKPITRRFKDAEDRMKLHQKMLLDEFQVIRDENFTQHLYDFQTFSKIIQEDVQGDRFKKYFDDVQAFVESVSKPKEQHVEQQGRGIGMLYPRVSYNSLILAASKLNEIYAWIGPSDYRDIYEKSSRAKLDNTSVWLLEREDSRQLRDSPFCTPQNDSNIDSSTATAPIDWKKRVMVIQGREHPP
jgi:hypothetical protein